MTALGDDPLRPRIATTARLLAVAALCGAALTAPSARAALRVQDGEPAQEAGAGRGGAADDEDASPQVRASRRALRDGTEEVPVLAIHATRLLDAGDVRTLAEVMAGSDREAILGILQALQTTTSVALLPESIVLASKAEDPEISRLTLDYLVRLARGQSDVTERLVARLVAADLPHAAQVTIVRVLGKSRDLRAVDPLVDRVDGALGDPARRALEELTGHAFGNDRLAWRSFWDRSRDLGRDVLLERSLASEREARTETESRMREEIVQMRIRLMGSDVDQLIGGLSDEYAAVRLASAQRLASHPNGEQAATAIPVLLDRLGYGANGHGYVNGDGGTNGQGEAGGRGEADPQVRAALVATLGVLGRGNAAVQDVLLSELRSGDPGIAAVAAAAFERLRDHPEVVDPLLDYVERSPVTEGTLVTVLRVVASNQPSGVLDRLAAWLDPAHSATVRAAAVAAIMASAELPAALAAVESVAGNEDVRDVRYALAKALGDRARTIPGDDPARPQVLALLGRLLDDVDASVRAEAASSVGEAGGADAFAQLDRRSRAETDAGVMVRIVTALGEIGEREGVGVIGRVLSSWTGDSAAELVDAARRALLVLGEGVAADGWLEMAGTLQEVGNPGLAAWALREILLRHEGDPGSRDVVSLARGHLAEVLCLNGQAAEAYQMLVELHEAGAPYPAPRMRLELLARTSEQLGRTSEAADWYLERLDELAEGDATRLETQRGAVRGLMGAGRWQEALPLVTELHDLDPTDNDVMFRLARVQAGLGRDHAAVATLRRLQARVPDEGDALRAEVEVLLAELEPAIAAEDALPATGTVPSEDGAPAGESAGDATVDGAAVDGVPDDGATADGGTGDDSSGDDAPADGGAPDTGVEPAATDDDTIADDTPAAPTGDEAAGGEEAPGGTATETDPGGTTHR